MESPKLPSTRDTKKIALFTGSFDPVTKGHLDIIVRASKLFDKLYVGVFDNPNKTYAFSAETRSDLLKENLSGFTNVEILSHPRDLTVNIAQKLQVSVLVRAIRSTSDFDYEANMVYFNHEMTGVETILLVAKPELGMISSSRVKELAAFAVDVSNYVPANVLKKLKEKYDN